MPALTSKLASRAAQKLLRLPEPADRSITVRRNVPVPMPDGVLLLADHYRPGDAGTAAPTVLVRTSSGRRAAAWLYGRPLAERGFQVVVQSVRGTGGSGGEFVPQVGERDDGLATVGWIRRQPWFDGRLATAGAGYGGLTQWAMADEAGLDALCVQAAIPAFDGPADGSFASWPGPAHGARVAEVKAPVALRTGWSDAFLPWTLRDYDALVAAGNPPRLTIGPWGHLSRGLLRGVARDTVDFLSERLLGASPRPGGPVRYYVTGADEWRYSEIWPPAGAVGRAWLLRPAGELTGDAGSLAHPGPVPPAGSASRFTYDPADPTPSAGGPTPGPARAVVDNRALEHRADVLVFTSLPLAAPVDVVGTPTARILVSAGTPLHDVFVRVCDVDAEGLSLNVSDGLVRLDEVPVTGGDGVRVAELELWPVAHRFAVGHRIRVQVSGGAHPRWARNPGTGEPLTVSVHHDEAHRSAVTLPVLPASVT